MSTDSSISHILVMEDEAYIRALLVKALQRRGHEVSEAPDGRAAIEQFMGLPEGIRDHCLLILDLVVPGNMGGRETLAEIRKTYPEIRAIIASGLADDEILAEIQQRGKTGILTKPFTIGDLDAAIQAIC